MNLHNIVSGAIGAINPFQGANVQYSNGYTTSADGSQVPSYIEVDNIQVQVQALTAKELQHLASLNIQGVMKALYLNGNSQGVVRPLGQGGDLFTLVSGTWLVTTVLETWDTGWCKVAVTLQEN
jgi:hypothetical protein